MHKLDEVGCFEETKRELAANRGASEQIVRQIKEIRRNIDDVKSAKTFRGAVDDAVIKVCDEAKEVIESIVEKYQAKIRKRIDDARGQELDVDEAMDEVARLARFAQKLKPDFQAELDELIRANLITTSNALLDEYKKRLASLTQDIGSAGLSSITIDPLKLMGGSGVRADDFSVYKLVHSKEVEDGKEWVKNTDKKWYKPWTWFQESGYWRKKRKTVKYIDASELTQEFLSPIQEIVFEDGDNARQHAQKQSNRIATLFNQEFKRLDDVLKAKLADLESYATEQEKEEARVRESEAKLQWLETIKKEVESILEI